MAQAQVIITGIDRTQAAINSAVRGMKTVERTAKVTARAVNLAFGFLTGTAIVSAFGKITDAAKKTEEGRRALDDLNRALKDPSLVSAATSFTTALVNGFTKVIQATTVVIKQIKSTATSLGFIAEPVDRSQLSNRGPSSRGRRGNVDEMSKMISSWASSLEIEKITAEQQKKVAESTKQARLALAEKQAEDNQRYLELKSQLGEIPDLYQSAFDASQATVSKSTQALLDDLDAKQQLFKEFASSAAQSMQSAFADFLFDPFKDGLKGMISGFLNVIRRMIAEIASQQILSAIFGGFTSKGGFLGAFSKAITGKAIGGPVSGGKPYIVGERGPELFVPGTSGGIVPNNRLAMGGGVTVAPVYNIDARGATADLQAALPSILQENNRRIFDELDRRYGIGR